MHPGLKVATAYSLPSFSLGFCGPQDKTSRKILSDYAFGQSVSEKAVRGIFEKFESAYHYYKLIAKKNNISDPLSEKIVKAFWVGNSLLDKVDGNDLQNLILTDFCRPGLLTKEVAGEKAEQVPEGARPHHSFHVLILGAVSDRITLKGAMLDLCRTGWGKVKELRIKNEELRIVCKPLLSGKKIRLGEETEKIIGWNRRIVTNVKKGDWVSFHWAQACEILTSQEVKNLEYYTQRTIDLVNGLNK
jgi:hypothetical protein